MRAKTFLLALFALVCAAAPASSAPPPVQVQPGWVFPVQDERDRRQLRPLREVIDMLRAQYGGEYVSYRVEDGPGPFM